MDHLPGSSIPKKKRRRDRLMEVAAADPEWATGFEDECWWSRVALPTLSSWAEEGKPMRLVQQSVAKEDPEPTGHLLLRALPARDRPDVAEVRGRGRPVSSLRTRFLQWCCKRLEGIGKKVLLLIWDNASWHVSKEVRRWLGKHNREVKRSSEGGVRIVSCLLPKQSPWLNAIEPKWIHGKRKVVEPDGLCLAPTSLPRGFAGSSAVRITSTYPFPGRSPDCALGSPLGVVFAVGSAVSWTLGTVYFKKYGERLSTLWSVALPFLIGGVFLMGLGLVLEPFSAISWNQTFVLSWLYTVLVGTALAWALWLGLVRAGEASRVSAYVFFVPIVSVLLGVLFLGEHLSLWLLAGAALIVCGIYLVNCRSAAKAG